MKKTLKTLALMAAAMLPAGASAEVLLSETFNYAAGSELYGQGGWLRSNHGLNPIKVTDNKLEFDGFMSGNSIKLTPESSQDMDVMRPCVERIADGTEGTVTPIKDGDIYVGMLINVQNVTYKTSFSSMVSCNSKSQMNDQKAASGDLNRMIVAPSENEGKFILGFDKASNNYTASQELDLNKTYLVVTHVKLVSGTTNDEFEAWINPTSTQTESTLKTQTASKADLSNGFVGIMISQATTGDTKQCPEMLVGPIKVATTWEELFDGEGGGSTVDPEPTPEPGEGGEVSATLGTNLSELALYQWQSYPITLNVKGKELTSDITLGGLGSDIKASTTTIAAADAMSADGFDVTLTVTPSKGENVSQTLTLTAGEATAEVPVEIRVYPVNTLMNFKFASTTNPWETYYFSGNARVTYVDAANETMYLEDPVGGLCVKYEYLYLDNPPFKAGDKLTKLYLMAEEPSFGVPVFQLASYFTPDGAGYGTLVGENDFKTPMEATLAEIVSSPEDYINRLVKVNDLMFAKAGETFSTSSTAVTSGSASGHVRAFSGSDLIGQTIPESAAVTGISTSMNAAVITARTAADVESAPEGEAEISITREVLVDAAEYYALGVDVPFAKLTVKTTAMANPTTVWIGGKHRDSFKTDISEIPAGTGTYTVTVTFCPTATGRNEAMINFDANPTELSQTLSVAGLGYDPENMPEFSVTPAELPEFSAAVGETQKQTLTISAANLLDYGSIKVLNQGQGAFLLGSTTFLKSGDTQLTVTFTPKSEGTFSETIEFSTPKAQTVTVTVSGKTTGGRPDEEKQGDELSFDVSAPKAQYSTDFTGSGENNKPLSLEGWKNVAINGTRAFWAVTTDNNTMAKVTGYDSLAGVDDDSDAEMLLLSPALDFKNCPNRLLEFKLMGNFMTDGMADAFNVLYIDPELPESERYQVIPGVQVPATSDENGEWLSYIIDLDAQNIAETFFIGFHYVTSRGRNSSAVYNVDDFSWGSTSTPFIRVDKTGGKVDGVVGTSTKIDDFKVSGLSLSGKITIELEGADKEHFALSHTELPAEGGTFSVNYAPTEAGTHAVYVNLKSDGAPVTVLTVGGMSTTSGVEEINAADGSDEVYYNLRGQRISRPTAPGIYIHGNRKVIVR